MILEQIWTNFGYLIEEITANSRHVAKIKNFKLI
jgi:hypothetical protein